MISVSGFCPPIIMTFPPPVACFSKVHTRFKGSELRFHYFLHDSEEWLRLPELNVDTTVKASKNRKTLPSPLLGSPLLLIYRSPYLLASWFPLLGRLTLTVNLCGCCSSIWSHENFIVESLELKGLPASVCVCVCVVLFYSYARACTKHVCCFVSVQSLFGPDLPAFRPEPAA